MADLEHNDSIVGLVRGILMDVRQLIREELALARVELKEQAARARLAAVMLGAALVALTLGTIFLLVALSIGIADLLGWPLWAGYLVVALLLSVGGVAMLASGRNRLRAVRPIPQQTVQTLKENSEWIAKRLSSDRR